MSELGQLLDRVTRLETRLEALLTNQDKMLGMLEGVVQTRSDVCLLKQSVDALQAHTRSCDIVQVEQRVVRLEEKVRAVEEWRNAYASQKLEARVASLESRIKTLMWVVGTLCVLIAPLVAVAVPKLFGGH